MKRADTQTKLKKIKELLKNKKGVIVALSGGVDSSLLLAIACEVLGMNVIAVTVQSLLSPPGEMKIAKRIASMFKCPHRIIHPVLLSDPSFIKNTRDRCYVCKKAIFKEMKQLVPGKGYTVIEASNASDMVDFRPGLRACKELDIMSPFVLTSLRKDEIRKIARQYSLPNWNAPSSACLASRIPYNTEITRERIMRIARSEKYLQNRGFALVRVRDHDRVARIEVSPSDLTRILKLRTRITRYFRRLGYRYVALDLEGYRTGSFNE